MLGTKIAVKIVDSYQTVESMMIFPILAIEIWAILSFSKTF